MAMDKKHGFRFPKRPCSDVEAVSGSFVVLQTEESHKSRQVQNLSVCPSERQGQQDGGSFFYRPKKLSDDSLSFWLGGS